MCGGLDFDEGVEVIFLALLHVLAHGLEAERKGPEVHSEQVVAWCAQPPRPGRGPWPEPRAAAPPQVALTPYDTLYVDRELGTAALTPGELKGWGGEDVLDLYRRLGELFEQSNKGDPEALKANPYVGICSHLTSLQ